MKRLFDIVLSLILILIFLPLFVVLAGLVRYHLGHPIIFRQQRVGLQAAPFSMLKFRTMTDECDEYGNLLADTDRLTPFGKWLRSTSLDEIPELWNVLCGEMSLVGPRPLHIYYLPRYSAFQARRHEVRPGLTGWAQINGRNSISWEEKFILDVWYVDNWNILLDLKILVLTVGKMISRVGVSSEGEATMPEFLGNAASDTKLPQ